MDGTGAKAFKADGCVKNDRIAEIWHGLKGQDGEEVFDAAERPVAPALSRPGRHGAYARNRAGRSVSIDAAVLQDLIDREAIRTLIYACCNVADGHDRDKMRSLYHEDAIDR